MIVKREQEVFHPGRSNGGRLRLLLAPADYYKD